MNRPGIEPGLFIFGIRYSRTRNAEEMRMSSGGGSYISSECWAPVAWFANAFANGLCSTGRDRTVLSGMKGA